MNAWGRLGYAPRLRFPVSFCVSEHAVPESHGNLVTAQTNALKLQAGLERLMARPIKPAEMPVPAPSARHHKSETPLGMPTAPSPLP